MSLSLRGDERVVRWLCLATAALALTGCFLDSAPIQSAAEQALPNVMATDARVADATLDGNAISTGVPCTDAASGCAITCQTESDCPAPAACQRALCDSGTCRVEAATCDDDSGACAQCGACQPGAVECTDGRTRHICDAQGQWSNAETCNVACVLGQCVECEPGVAECVEQALRSCSNEGRWNAPSVCEQGCSGGSCNECMPAAVACSASGTEALSCAANGRWQAAESCERGCVAGRCRSCSEGAKRCSGDSQELCAADGTWKLEAACSNGCVSDHCATCKVGTRECTDLSNERVCRDNGEWSEPTFCLGGCTLDQCSECLPGAQRCAGPGIQRCSPERRWETIMACPFGCSGTTCAVCTEGAIECTSTTTLRTCRNNSWSSSDSCRPDAHCDAAAPGGNSCPCDAGYSDPHPNPGLCTAQ